MLYTFNKIQERADKRIIEMLLEGKEIYLRTFECDLYCDHEFSKLVIERFKSEVVLIDEFIENLGNVENKSYCVRISLDGIKASKKLCELIKSSCLNGHHLLGL